MKAEKLIQSKREEELIWYLSKEGVDWIRSEKRVKYVKNNILHYIMRNQVYIHFKPTKWETETPVKWNGKKDDIIKPDAIFEKNNTIYFLEVDNKQHMKANHKKIQKYKKMKDSNILQKQYGAFPYILYVTTTEYRQKQLRSYLTTMKSEVLLFNDLK